MIRVKDQEEKDAKILNEAKAKLRSETRCETLGNNIGSITIIADTVNIYNVVLAYIKYYTDFPSVYSTKFSQASLIFS